MRKFGRCIIPAIEIKVVMRIEVFFFDNMKADTNRQTAICTPMRMIEDIPTRSRHDIDNCLFFVHNLPRSPILMHITVAIGKIMITSKGTILLVSIHHCRIQRTTELKPDTKTTTDIAEIHTIECQIRVFCTKSAIRDI